jgi:hypothetical protein
MQIFVNLAVKGAFVTETLTVKPKSTISDVKQKVQDRFKKISPDNYYFTSAGKQLTDDNKTLDDYNIPEKSVLLLMHRLRGGLRVKSLSGNTYSVTAEPDDTILYVKALILSVTGVPCHIQHLIYNERELDDDRQSLFECGIQVDETVCLVLRLKTGCENLEDTKEDYVRVKLQKAACKL